MATMIPSPALAIQSAFTSDSTTALSPRCQAMEAQIAELCKRLELSEKKNAAALEEIAKANAKLQDNENEIAGLVADLEGSAGYGKAKREEYKILQAEFQTLQGQAAQLQASSTEAQAKVVSLESKVAQLQEERALKEPLYEIGVSIRIRFFETAKKTVLGLPRGQTGHQSIRSGNAAAHSAIGKADAALFKGNLLSNADREGFRRTFLDLYKCSPETYDLVSPTVLRVIECEATIRTLQVLNEGNRPICQRQLVLDQTSALNFKFSKMTRAEFENDADVNWRISRVEELTREIVEEDRQSRANIQSSGRTRQSSQY